MIDPLQVVNDDILSAVGAHFKSLITERDDWKDAHISDLYGCDFATHARRTGDKKPVEDRDAEGCLKMQIGVHVEDHIADGLSKKFNTDDHDGFERGERIAWNPNTGVTRRGLFPAGHSTLAHERDTETHEHLKMVPCKGCHNCSPLEGEIIGHLDGVITQRLTGGEVVVEIKSTAFFRGKVPTEPAPWYIEQAASYAVAINAKSACILIADRESGRIAGPFWLELDGLPPFIDGVYSQEGGTLRQQTIARAKQMLERTDPLAFPPDPKPRYKWQVNYCKLGAACACKGAK